MTENRDDFEARLRASLADQARGAPDGHALGDSVLSAVEHDVPRPIRPPDHPRWRAWGLPLVAAAAVAAIVGGAVGVSHLRTDADPASDLRHTTQAPVSTPAPVTTPTAIAPSSGMTLPPAGQTIYTLTDFRVRDLTFVGPDQGWALGTADCLNGSGQTCTALAYSTDGLRWTGQGTTPFNVPGVTGGCADPCVTDVRFADARTGYAYGPTALFMTTDGAQTWRRQPGGAAALETLNGNVIRVVAQPAGCTAPGCSYEVLTSSVGSTAWQPSSISATADPGMRSGVELSRTGRVAVLAVFGHPTGGASSAPSALYTSTDNGLTWSSRGEVCPQNGTGSTPEVDTSAVTTATDGSILLACTARTGQTLTVGTSTDQGASFSFGPTMAAPGGSPPVALVAASRQSVVIESDALYRSTNGGATFAKFGSYTSNGSYALSWLGFESASAGRAVDTPPTGPSTIWTTHNGGATWTPVYLH